MSSQQIIAVGGGGFGGDTAPGLDTYLLEVCEAAEPRIGFLPTATGDSDTYVVRFYQRFLGLPCRPSHVPLFRRTPALADWAKEQDLIYVGGGNTKSMLAVWRAWGLDEVLRRAYDAGTVLAGVSAGAICWFEEGLTDSWADDLHPLPCLGFLEGSCCPHWTGEADRQPRYEELVAGGEIRAGIAIDDGAGVHFLDGKPHRIVSALSGATARRIRTDGSGGALHEPLEIETVPREIVPPVRGSA